ncbi:hypothetical protein BST46_25800 [Mycobacterium timonense]|uniref:Uncharacterized protein n=1 Tax=Mycobacterium timonense TaxID=701043 RepID=A0ABX3TEK8_9MYCO|nr:hypothetical protein BST46_25800 [Mycobacterium timonense]
MAGTIAVYSFRLRIPLNAPATDTTSLQLCRRLNDSALHLAYVAEQAADELARAMEAVLAYAYNVALIGLAVDAPTPLIGVSTERTSRTVATSAMPALPQDDDGILSEAVLLSGGLDAIAHQPVETAQLRAASATLHDCARRLRASVSSGDRPAATFDHFGGWVDSDFASGLDRLDRAITSWSVTYAKARDEVQGPANIYRRWLVAAAASADQDRSEVGAAAVRACAALHEYSATPIGAVACAAPPRVGHPLP